MATARLKVEKRTDSGKGAARRLRTAGQIPGVIYGAGKAPTPIIVNSHDLMMIVKEGGFYSRVLTAEIDGGKEQVLPRELQRDPVRGRYLHLDLLRFDPKKKITLSVPITITGEEASPGVKEGGMLQLTRGEVEVLCLASNIPEELQVSVAEAKMGDNVRFSDLTLPEGVELTDEEDRTIASIVSVRASAEEETEEGETLEAGAEEADGDSDGGDTKDEA